MPIAWPATFAATALFWVAFARADDWPQFRGPGRDGVWHETGLLKTFPADGLRLAWRAPVGLGWSSPIVAQGRIFVTDSQLLRPYAQERVLCFDAAAGVSLWQYAYDVEYPEWAYVHGQGGAPSATPAADDGRVFALGPCGQVHCLDARNGALVWRRELNKEFEIKVLSCRPSPLIDGDRLIVFTGARPGASVLALDKATGATVWKALDDGVSNSSPVIIEAGGARQLIVWSDESVTSLDPATGTTYWRVPMVTSNNDDIPTPVADGGKLLVGGLMFALDPERPAATVLWPGIDPAAKRLLSNTSTAVVLGGYVYSARGAGELVCLDAATGNSVWSVDTVTERANGASIHITPADGAMFLFTDRGDLVRAQLDPKGYTELGRTHLIDPTTPFAGKQFAWPPPAYANGHVYARNDAEVVCAALAAGLAKRGRLP